MSLFRPKTDKLPIKTLPQASTVYHAAKNDTEQADLVIDWLTTECISGEDRNLHTTTRLASHSLATGPRANHQDS